MEELKKKYLQNKIYNKKNFKKLTLSKYDVCQNMMIDNLSLKYCKG